MTLQCLYLVIKSDEKFEPLNKSTVRELINLIAITASLDMNGSLLFAFDQFLQYLQTNDRSKEANLFTSLFFGSNSCFTNFSKSFRQNTKLTKNVPAITRIYNDFESRYTKQMHANMCIVKEAQAEPMEYGKEQFTVPKQTHLLRTSLEKIKSLDSHEYFMKRERGLNSKEL